jgi:hypothetical protein
MKWGTEQVKWLHENDRMFTHRDHIHTLMYRFLDEQRADADGVPAELALDHPFRGVVAVIGEVSEGKTHDDVVAWFRDRPCPAEVMTAFTPVPLFQDAPSDVPRNEATDRFMQLYFLDEDPLEVFDDRFGDLGEEFEGSDLGRILFVSPFLATVPGTDRYADELR